MNIRVLVLLLTVVVPGFAASSISTYYLFTEWSELQESYKLYDKVAKSPSPTIQQLSIAQAVENRHRINCFAEGVGVLLGGVMFAIGIHGICAQSSTKEQ